MIQIKMLLLNAILLFKKIVYFCVNCTISISFRLVREFVDLLSGLNGKQEPLLIAPTINEEQLEDIRGRLKFYAPGLSLNEISVRPDVDFLAAISMRPLLFFGKQIPKCLYRWRSGTFDVDYRTNPGDGWAWNSLSGYLSSKPNITKSKHIFKQRIHELTGQGLSRCYIFGTGPSLDKAFECNWSDGYRIVCNTIVRDRNLWQHIDPHFIVAGDAIYHFGHTAFARAFRRDLSQRLTTGNTYFLYPSIFDAVVRRELGHLAERLIPVPIGGVQKKINIDLTKQFALPPLGNVLSLLLLPVACTLSRDVYLWGFDGRAPNDKLFWSNSQKQTYTEFLPELEKAHPAFFENNVPQNDPFKYVKAVHGDILEESLRLAEYEGWKFNMMHHSWTSVLDKRYRSS